MNRIQSYNDKKPADAHVDTLRLLLVSFKLLYKLEHMIECVHVCL